MGDPKTAWDVCRFCGHDVVWMARDDPDMVERPEEPPNLYEMTPEERAAYDEAYAKYREWYRRRPSWAGKWQWWHSDGNDDWLECKTGQPEGEENRYAHKIVAKAKNFCDEMMEKQDNYRYTQEMCNRPVIYEDEDDNVRVCGVHAKPYIEKKEREQKYAEQRAVQAALDEQVGALIEHLESLGIKAERIRSMGRIMGSVSLPMEDVVKLLRLAGKKEPESQSGADEMDEAEGFNPFLDIQTDDDEESIDDEWEFA